MTDKETGQPQFLKIEFNDVSLLTYKFLQTLNKYMYVEGVQSHLKFCVWFSFFNVEMILLMLRDAFFHHLSLR